MACYAYGNHIDLQGRVQFPTGGKVRARKLNRCDSDTDSKVWMEEGPRTRVLYFYALSLCSGHIFMVVR